MAALSGKRVFLELLKQEGVDVIFGNPGTTELPLMDALAADPSLRYVLGLQEAALMAMADGYAQASGRLTVVEQTFNVTEPTCEPNCRRLSEGAPLLVDLAVERSFKPV